MNYRVIFRPSARKALDKLADDVFRRLTPKIDVLARTPRPSGCTKLAGHPNLYRLRAGDWRIVYEIDDPGRVVTITLVAHRREVYRGL